MFKTNNFDSNGRKSFKAATLLLGFSILLWTVTDTDAKKKKKVSLDKYTTLVRSTTTTTTTTEATTTVKLEELYPVPLADSALSAKILKFVSDAYGIGLVERGTNSATMAAHVGIAEIVVMAADTDPLDVLRKTINICRLDDIPYVFIPKQSDLGTACGLNMAAASCAIIRKSDMTAMKDELNALKRDIAKIAREQKGIIPPKTTAEMPLYTSSP